MDDRGRHAFGDDLEFLQGLLQPLLPLFDSGPRPMERFAEQADGDAGHHGAEDSQQVARVGDAKRVIRSREKENRAAGAQGGRQEARFPAPESPRGRDCAQKDHRRAK